MKNFSEIILLTNKLPRHRGARRYGRRPTRTLSLSLPLSLSLFSSNGDAMSVVFARLFHRGGSREDLQRVRNSDFSVSARSPASFNNSLENNGFNRYGLCINQSPPEDRGRRLKVYLVYIDEHVLKQRQALPQPRRPEFRIRDCQ